VRWARRTATIIAVATGLVPQLPAWHPPLTVAPPVLHRLPPPRSCSCRTDATSSAAGALEVVVSGRRVTVGHARLQLRGGRLSPFCRRWRQHLRGRRHHRHCTPRAATSTVQITSRYGAQRKRRVLRSSCSPSPRCCSSTNRPRGSTRGWTARSCTPCGSWPTTTARRGHNAQRGRGGLNRSWQQLDREGGGGWERRGCRNWPLTPSRHSRRAACGDPALRRHGRHWAPTENDIPLAYAPLDAPTTLRRPCSSTAWVSTPRAPPAVVPGPVSRGVAGCDGPFRTRRPHPERSTAVDRRRAHRRLRGHRVLRRRHVCLPLLSCPSTCGRAATRAGRRTLGSWSRPTR
jgi:hypothetical protein